MGHQRLPHVHAGPAQDRYVPTSIDLGVDMYGQTCLLWTDELDIQKSSVRLEGCLYPFIKLKDAGDDNILEFARRWGLLRVCSHSRVRSAPGTEDWGVPTWTPTHSSCSECAAAWLTVCRQTGWHVDAPFGGAPPDDPHEWVLRRDVQYCLEQYGCPPGIAIPVLGEPLAAWRNYATLIGALLGIAADLQSGAALQRQELEVLGGWGIDFDEDDPRNPTKRARESDEDFRRRLAHQSLPGHVDTWIRIAGGIRTTVEWGSDRMRYAMYGERLLGQVTTELLAALTSEEGKYHCSYCRSIYDKRQGMRRPDLTRPHYCSEPCRLASRAAKEKRRYEPASKGA
jgi:hypothetical protein